MVKTAILVSRHWHKNIVNTVMFATRGKKYRKHPCFELPKRKNNGVYCYSAFSPRASKQCENRIYLTIFRGQHKREKILAVLLEEEEDEEEPQPQPQPQQQQQQQQQRKPQPQPQQQ